MAKKSAPVSFPEPEPLPGWEEYESMVDSELDGMVVDFIGYRDAEAIARTRKKEVGEAIEGLLEACEVRSVDCEGNTVTQARGTSRSSIPEKGLRKALAEAGIKPAIINKAIKSCKIEGTAYTYTKITAPKA